MRRRRRPTLLNSPSSWRRSQLREKERAHFTATSTLEEAKAPRKTLDEMLAAARGEEEKWAAIEEHMAEAGRPPITVEELRKLRQAVATADDEVVAARSALDLARDQAGRPIAALSRAKDRRTRAVQEVVRPEVGRLMREVQAAIETLQARSL
jgi:hypothetical protein